MKKETFLTGLFASLSVLIIGIVVILVVINYTNEKYEEPPFTERIDAGNGEYFYVKADVLLPYFLPLGYSLRSTKDERRVYSFSRWPVKISLEDFDGDRIKDLVFIISDPDVKGERFLQRGYSKRVALGNGDGTFKKASVVATIQNLPASDFNLEAGFFTQSRP